MNGYYNEQLKAINKQDATKLLDVGEYPIPENLNKVNLAAMMEVIDTMYNMEETITKT